MTDGPLPNAGNADRNKLRSHGSVHACLAERTTYGLTLGFAGDVEQADQASANECRYGKSAPAASRSISAAW
jgi:hypothetical protein